MNEYSTLYTYIYTGSSLTIGPHERTWHPSRTASCFTPMSQKRKYTGDVQLKERSVLASKWQIIMATNPGYRFLPYACHFCHLGDMLPSTLTISHLWRSSCTFICNMISFDSGGTKKETASWTHSCSLWTLSPPRRGRRHTPAVQSWPTSLVSR